ncbi:folate-sensitive fragile site protein Fra10Ac1-domain-containing protein [Chytriomyces sp. MP71]|nr:folate-sensitive fragile site protein Fra10Ac1-domain-containing protein [Chytriomyces sp. MP71]
MADGRQAQSSTYLRMPTASKPSSVFRQQMSGLNAYQKHLSMVHSYARHFESSVSHTAQNKVLCASEVDILRRNHRFLREDDTIAEDTLNRDSDSAWEQRVAKKYYDKLFKEFAIANLERFKEGKVALRWRTKREVLAGIDLVPAGYPFPVAKATNNAKSHQPGLKSWEVNFGYKEDGEYKNALVKVRLCMECGFMLNYKKDMEKRQKKQEEEQKEKQEFEQKKRKSEKKKERGSPRGSEKRRRKEKSDVECSVKSDDEEDEDGETDKRSSGGEPEEEVMSSKSLASEIWGAPQVLETEKSRDEEMDSFFDDLFAST